MIETGSAIASGISATRAAVELLKGARELLRRPEANPAEILGRLTELQDLLLDAKLALTEAASERGRLEQRIAELERMSVIGNSFKSLFGVYWHEGYPYCPVCWDVDRKPVRLSGPADTRSHYQNWTCPFHKQPIAMPFNVLSTATKELNKP